MSKPVPPTYRTTNWRAYNAALRQRGLLRIWFDPEMDWRAPPSGRRGRTATFSDAAIQTCLMLKSLFGLPLRQTTGLVESLLKLAKLDWPVPDFSTLCRRQKDLTVRPCGHRSRALKGVKNWPRPDTRVGSLNGCRSVGRMQLILPVLTLCNPRFSFILGYLHGILDFGKVFDPWLDPLSGDDEARRARGSSRARASSMSVSLSCGALGGQRRSLRNRAECPWFRNSAEP